MPDGGPRRLRPALVACAVASCVFAGLAFGVATGATFAFDAPLMLRFHAHSNPVLDRAAWWLAHVGYGWGVLPFDAVLVVWLALRRRRRDAMFAAVTLGLSLTLDTLLKLAFERPRPQLWLPSEAQQSWSFPSAHAMADATLACVLVALAWNTRWRWPVLVAAAAFTVAVGIDRVYAGVHYPSDVLGGWAAGAAWACAMHACFYRPARR